MSEPNEETEIKQDIKMLVCSQRENFVLYLAPNSTFKDLLLLIENRTQWIHDYKSVTFEIGNGKKKKVVTKSDLNFRLEELDIQDSDTIQANISNKKLENSISLEDLIGHGNQSRHLPRIIVGVLDLILLLAAIITFLLYFLTSLSFSIAVPIVLTVLFVAVAILFFGWKSLLPKILPDGCLKKPDLGTNFGEKDNNKTKKIENNKENSPKEKEKTDNQLS